MLTWRIRKSFAPLAALALGTLAICHDASAQQVYPQYRQSQQQYPQYRQYPQQRPQQVPQQYAPQVQQQPRQYLLGVYGEVVDLRMAAPAAPSMSMAAPEAAGSMADEGGMLDPASNRMGFSGRSSVRRPPLVAPRGPAPGSMADDVAVVDPPNPNNFGGGRTPVVPNVPPQPPVNPLPPDDPGFAPPPPPPPPLPPSYGLRITSVIPGSAAARYGYEPGDIIKFANGYKIENMDHLRWVLARSGGAVRLTIIDVRTGLDRTTDVRL